MARTQATVNGTTYWHHSRMEELGWGSRLAAKGTTQVHTLLGRYPVRLQQELAGAVAALEQALIDSGYENPCDYIGSWNVRKISGTSTWSEHSYGTAIDLDYGGDNVESPDHPGIDKNPHIHRRILAGDPGFGHEWQISEAQVRAVEAVVNDDGVPIWRWLGWAIGDTMHWSVNVGPQACQVAGVYEAPDLSGRTPADIVFPQLRHGAGLRVPSTWVKILQLKLADAGMADANTKDTSGNQADGIFWDGTESSVLTFQAAHGLVSDGVVGDFTWGALFA
jgi:hypothetical protein